MTEQDFLEQLHELNNKINFAKELSFRETLACSDIQDIVDRLKLKVSQGRCFFSLSARCWSEGVKLYCWFPPGCVQDPRVHPAEDLLLQEANDQLPDPTEHFAQVQVSFSTNLSLLLPDTSPHLSVSTLSRFFYQFLLANERTVAKEIRDEYVDTMSKIYYSYFKSYSSRLLKVQVSVTEPLWRGLQDGGISAGLRCFSRD